MTELNKTVGQSQIEAARFAASHVPAEFLSSVSTVVKAKEDWEGGPVTICTALDTYYPGDAFDAFPEPRSKGGNNPALFPIAEPSGKDGKLKDKEKNYYHVFADSLPPAITLYQHKDWLERLGNEKMKTDGIPPEFIAEYGGAQHSKLVARDTYLTKIKRRIANYRQSIMLGFDLKFQLLKVNELGGCHAEIVPSADGKGYENRIRVRSSMPGRELEDNEGMTVKAFLKLDTMTAFKNGATFQALMATKKREQGDDPANAAGSRITSREQAYKVIADLHVYLDAIVTDSKQETFAAIVKALNSKAGDDMFMTFCDVRDILTDMIAKTHQPGERRVAIANRQAEQKAA